MLRRLSMHAAGVEEPAANYIWEDLSAPEIEKGAVLGFTLMTSSLREHAIAGVLHLDHLASLSGFWHSSSRGCPRRPRNRRRPQDVVGRG